MTFDGGVFRSGLTFNSDQDAALLNFYSQTLEATESKILEAGGTISKGIFTSPAAVVIISLSRAEMSLQCGLILRNQAFM